MFEGLVVDQPVTGSVVDWLRWGIGAYLDPFFITLIRYALAGAVLLAITGLLMRTRFASRKIQDRKPTLADYKREILLSLSTIAIFGVTGITMIFAVQRGWTQAYFDVSEYGWTYLVLSSIAAILLHDAYYYWAHRLLHARSLFRRVHKWHHRSHTPSVWAGYSFHPAEAVAMTVIAPMLLFTLPLHPIAFTVWTSHQVLRNVMGHCGVELFPRGWNRHWLGKWISPVTHHDMHHSRVKGNYGLYFTFWDRLMGTLHAEYEETFERVTAPAPRRVKVKTRTEGRFEPTLSPA